MFRLAGLPYDVHAPITLPPALQRPRHRSFMRHPMPTAGIDHVKTAPIDTLPIIDWGASMDDRQGSNASTVRSFTIIAVTVVVVVTAFVFTAGWLSSGRLTPARLVDKLAPPGGPALGYRRNHAKGICFTGTFESNGNAASLSKAAMFAAGSLCRHRSIQILGTPSPKAADPTVRVRGLGLRIVTPDGTEWRSAMIGRTVLRRRYPAGVLCLATSARKQG